MNEQQRFEQLRAHVAWGTQIECAGGLLQLAARTFSDRIALVCGDDSVTFAQLYAHAVKLSIKLRDQGLKPGDRGALLFANSIEFYIAYYALWQCGAVVMPLNTFLRAGELQHIFTESKPQVLIAQSTLPVVQELLKVVSVPQTITDLKYDPNMSDKSVDFEIPVCDPHAMSVLLYTSGTTGAPKGVMLSAHNILGNLVQGLARFDVLSNDRVFAVLPLFHAFAQNTCVWGPVLTGTTVIVVPKIERRAILRGLQHKPTLVLGVPALYGLFCLLKNLPFDQVRYFISGGDAMPDKIRTYFALIYRRKISNGYGLTETAPVIAVQMDDEFVATECVGKPVMGVECSIRDEQGNKLPQGEIGILWVRGENIMLGYYKAPEATESVMQDGWFCTGDFARVDMHGRLSMCGRHKDLIIHKGFNVYPQEIENILSAHAAVMCAAVIGMRDNEGNEIPAAFITLRDGIKDNGEKLVQELREHCAYQLAAYKVPRTITICDELPLTATGKVDKKELRKRVGSAS